MIPPSSIGLPPKFRSWYPGQWDLIEGIFESNRRFSICPAPTGTGKSAVAMALALMSGGRTVHLTPTKGKNDEGTKQIDRTYRPPPSEEISV